MQAVAPYLRIALPALLTVCIFIGTFGNQYIYPIKGHVPDASIRYYLYKVTQSGETFYFAKYGKDLFGCSPPLQIFNATLAMGVIGCACMLAAVAAAVVLLKAPTNASVVLASRVAQGLASITITICLALDIALYRSNFCGGSIPLSDNFKLDYGFVFIIISFILIPIWGVFNFMAAPKSGWGVDENMAPLN